MVEAEATVATDEPMVAEEAAGRIANRYMRAGPRPGPRRCVENRMIIPQPGARAGNCQTAPRDLPPVAIVQDDLGCAQRPPRARRRIDQLAQGVIVTLAEPQKQACGQSRRTPD